MGTEADGHILRQHLDYAAHGVASVAGGVNLGGHALGGGGVGAAHRRVFHGLPVYLRRRSGLYLSDGKDVAVHRDAELLQQPQGDCASGDAGGGLAGAGPFQHVAHVVEAVFHRAGQVGVAGAQAGHALAAGALRLAPGFKIGGGAHRHGLFPVGPVAVFDGHTDGAAQRRAVAHAGDDVRPVLLDEHTPAAPVPLLSAGQVDADIVLVNGQPGRHALDDDDQPWPWDSPAVTKRTIISHYYRD